MRVRPSVRYELAKMFITIEPHFCIQHSLTTDMRNHPFYEHGFAIIQAVAVVSENPHNS